MVCFLDFTLITYHKGNRSKYLWRFCWINCTTFLGNSLITQECFNSSPNYLNLQTKKSRRNQLFSGLPQFHRRHNQTILLYNEGILMIR